MFQSISFSWSLFFVSSFTYMLAHAHYQPIPVLPCMVMDMPIIVLSACTLTLAMPLRFIHTYIHKYIHRIGFLFLTLQKPIYSKIVYVIYLVFDFKEMPSPGDSINKRNLNIQQCTIMKSLYGTNYIQ